MNKIIIILTALALMASSLACCCAFPVNVNPGKPLEVGELQEKEETVPRDEAASVDVEILFGAGELTVAAGESDQLLSGRFLYNVDEWEPEITYDDDKLIVQQGANEEAWGWSADKEIRNEWDLELSPEVAMDMDIKIGAGQGNLDLARLQIEQLNVDLGAGDFTISFDEPNAVEMGRFIVNVGAANLKITDIGNASPKKMTVQGGVGELTMDLTGDWARSADITVASGVGKLTLHLPNDIGVKVNVEGGLANVETSGLQHSGGAYTNDAYGEAETELDIQITTGVGQVNLEVVD